jgi:hypothetical protein
MNDEQMKEAKKSGGVSIRIVGIVTTVIAVAFAFFAFVLAGYIADAQTSATMAEKRYVECSQAINSLQDASDYLTTNARLFVTAGRRECMDNYVSELSSSNRRGNAVGVLKANLAADLGAVDALEKAFATSNELAQSELAAMRLACDYYGIEDAPKEVAEAPLDMFRSELDKDAKLQAAEELLLSDTYDAAKARIMKDVEESLSALLEQLDAVFVQGDAVDALHMAFAAYIVAFDTSCAAGLLLMADGTFHHIICIQIGQRRTANQTFFSHGINFP